MSRKEKSSEMRVEVDVTCMNHEEKMKTIEQYTGKKGFVECRTSWQNQFTPNERKFYTFIYKTAKRSASKKIKA